MVPIAEEDLGRADRVPEDIAKAAQEGALLGNAVPVRPFGVRCGRSAAFQPGGGAGQGAAVDGGQLDRCGRRERVRERDDGLDFGAGVVGVGIEAMMLKGQLSRGAGVVRSGDRLPLERGRELERDVLKWKFAVIAQSQAGNRVQPAL